MRYDKKQLSVYRGVLKNKNLATILEEGLTAPVGSTKRKRAQKVLSVIRKTSHDGKGGPGPRIPRVNVRLQPRTVDYSNFLILPPTPPIRVPFGEKAPTPKPTVHDGQGFAPAGLLAAAPYAVAGLGALSRFGGTAMNAMRNAPAFATGGARAATALNTALAGGAGLAALNASGANNKPAASTSSQAPKINMPLYGSPALSILSGDTGPKTPGQFAESLRSGEGKNTQNTNPVAGMPMRDFSIALAGGAPGSQSTEMTSPYQAPKFANVQSAVEQGTGPSMFAYNTLSAGGDTLKQLAPNASGLMLEGGGLYDRLMKIEESTRKSYGLDQMRDQLNSMVMSGQTLEGRLTDYIRGRDEFLNETEDTIQDLKNRSMKMDMSNPTTRANMQQHFNYLYELRGRQNKRYVEFLGMSVEAYQGKIDRVKNMYDTTFAQYEQQVLNNQNIAKEEYQMIFTGLQEMYNETADAERKMWELEGLKQQVVGARLQTIKDGYAAEGLYSGDAIELDKALKTHGILGENGEWNPNNNALTLSDVNVYRLPEKIDEGIARAMYVYSKDGTTSLRDMGDYMYRVSNALGHLDQLKAAQILTDEAYVQRKQNITDHLERYLEQNPAFLSEANLPSYRKAIESLAGDGWLFNRSTPSREKFINKWQGEGLDTSVLNFIYTDMEQFRTPKEYVDTLFSKRDELGQSGEPITSDAALRKILIGDYLRKLKPQQIAGTPNFSSVGGGTNSASLSRASQAISNIESSGRYDAVGQPTASGDRAYGKYQVMGANIPSWTKQVLGVELTPQQFLNMPAAQDAVFNTIFGGYIQQYGNVEDAASMWFSGRPMAQAGNARDILGTTVPQYVSKFQQSYYS
jgi:hypothetical protein